MKGDLDLKVYGANLVQYEEDKGWVVPEIAPDPEYNPPYVPPSTDPNDLELITDIQWVSGKLDYNAPITEEVEPLSGRYTTRWVKVKPDTRYRISSKFTNAFVLQSKTEGGVITYMPKPDSVVSANTPMQTKADASWVRFYFYVGYEASHEINMQEFVVADPAQIPPFDVTEVELGYIDGNKAELQRDPYRFTRSTGWFSVKPDTTYLMYFNASNRCYMQLKGKDVHYNGSINYPITYVTDPASDTTANSRLFTTMSNTVEARVFFAEDIYSTAVIKMFEQLPT